MKNTTRIYIGVLTCLLLSACKDTDDLVYGEGYAAETVIRVGGIDTDGLTASAIATRGDGDDDEEEVISEEEVQRTDAENISWLVGPLKKGLDITYGKASDRTGTSRVAILKLLSDDGGGIKYTVDEEDDSRIAEYSFLYRDDENGNPTDIPAVWYDNGAHFFEGLHIPAKIQYRNESQGTDSPAQELTDVYGPTGSAPNLSADQHNDNTAEATLGNYTLLSHYLGMPSNFTLNATVARIKLPFRHRLARVLAYILIDPDMGEGVKINGYSLTDGKDDPTTSSIRFCNVNVLAGVKDSYNATTQHHTYTPQWMEVRKAVPHFVGERGSYDDSKNVSINDEHFIAYYDAHKKTYYYPTDPQWATIRDGQTFPDGVKTKTANLAYERTIYGKVPVYDLIVRPTYTALDRVMYDEENVDDATTKQNLYVLTNQIEFEITLNNGLQYSKRFIFDLDANYQTVVYLHISRERVDYNSSGSDLWVETLAYDDWYGVNNQNGNTLSFAGSGWQRAYTYGKTFTENVTDGHYYYQDGEDKYAQYVDDDTWIEMFREAHEGGLHHGDYFILESDISIPAAALPENFVFTGHLDGLDHTITLTGADYTKVTQRAYDSFEDYDNHTDTRYIKLADNSYQIFTSVTGATYCSRGENTGTEQDPVYEYTVIPDIAEYNGASAYIRTTIPGENEGDPETYSYGPEIKFYKKVHHAEVTETVPGKSPTSLFTGLNGNYSTPQESDVTAIWQANVHKEQDKWVPFKTATDGWRAEIINTNINGGTVFPAGTTYLPEDAESKVTGYVHNCWEGSTYNGSTHKWSGGTKVRDYTPSLPEY